jgi:cell division protein FtsB
LTAGELGRSGKSVETLRLRRPRRRTSGRNKSHPQRNIALCAAERGADGASVPSLPSIGIVQTRDFTFPAAIAVFNSGPMNVDLGIWGKLTRFVIALLVIALLGIIWQWYLPLINQNERMRKTTFHLDEKIQVEEAAQKQYKSSIDTLRYDTNAIERLAREKLRYAKPDETVIVFEPSVTNRVAH